jgi:hypothetical protein
MKMISMKRISLLVAVMLVLTAGTVMAATSSTPSPKDVGKMNAEISLLNSYKSLPQGDKIISKQLTDTFSVTKDKVDSLLSKTLQIGDAAAVLAFAEKLSGGITDANINKVVTMKSRGGWDQVARNLNVDMASVAGKLSTFEDDAHRSIKQALADSYASGRATGGISEDPHSGMGESVPGEATGGMDSESGTGGTDSDSMGGSTGGTDSGTMGGSTGGTDSGATGGTHGGY